MSVRIRRGYVDLERGQIHYRRAETRGAPALILLHQTPSSSAMYEPLMGELAGRFDLIALDTPGFGESDALPGPFSVATAAAGLRAAVRMLRAEPCFWFGHHTGAALALQVATDDPAQVAALAMSGPCLLTDSLRERLPQLAAELPLAADGSHLPALWQRIAAKDGQAPAALRQREVLAGAAAGPAYAQAYAAVVQVDTQAQLRALQCPTLVFAGTLDPLHGQLDAAYALLARGEKAEIAGARTFLCELQVREVGALLGKFFGAQHG